MVLLHFVYCKMFSDVQNNGLNERNVQTKGSACIAFGINGLFFVLDFERCNTGGPQLFMFTETNSSHHFPFQWVKHSLTGFSTLLTVEEWLLSGFHSEAFKAVRPFVDQVCVCVVGQWQKNANAKKKNPKLRANSLTSSSWKKCL